MLKFATYTVAWILTILLLIAPVIKTERYNTVNNHLSTRHYHNYNYSQDLSNNILSKSIKRNNKCQSYQVDYKWRRRTLCAISDNDKYSTGSLLENNKGTGKRKTLLDYGEPVPVNDVDDPDSLTTHVRVKKSKAESDSISSFRYQQDYLKDLANSFPRDSYESIGENIYDDDASFDRKREIKSHQYFVNDKQINAIPDENAPITVPSYFGEDKSDVNNFISSQFTASGTDALGNNNVKFIDRTKSKESVSLQEPLSDVIINRKSHENPEDENLPDPILAVELVRKKRNDYSKIHNKKNLKEQNLSDLQAKKEKSSNEREQSIPELETFKEHSNPPSSNIADLRVDLLRFRRKTRNNNGDKIKKLKQKKKRVGKKHDFPENSLRSIKDVRSKNMGRPRVSRKRKMDETKSEGNLKVGIVNVVAKKNNDNNFHRRSVKSKKSIDSTDSENDHLSKNVPSALHAKLETKSKNKNDDDISILSLVRRDSKAAGGASDSKAETDKSSSAFVVQYEKQKPFVVQYEKQKPFVETEKLMPPQDSKLRAKRNKHTESNHGFLNKEEELKYYKNIQEPGTVVDHCDDEDENQLSMMDEVGSNRAVRSIEEVKELAKKLVTKVNELQNYLNIEETSGNEKQETKLKTRAIDDLCANVSSGCGAFKEAPEIVQKCVAANHDRSATKIVERKANPVEMTNKHKLEVKIPKKHSVEKRRSVARHVVKTSSSTSKAIRNEEETKSGRKWGKWTDWSSCSVTCGKGRQIRWRYCLRDCSTAETEMEEKACQLPACPPGKFLGIF